MALPLSNNLEGGTNGSAITVANSGGVSGNAFDTGPLQDTGSVLTYDNAQTAHGSLAAKIALGAAAAAEAVGWAASMGSQTDFYVRFYVRLQVAPPQTLQLVRFYNSGVLVGNVQINLTTPTVSIRNATPVTTGTGGSIPLNQWVRVECHYFAGDGATTGFIETKLFYTLDATTPDVTITGTAGSYGTLCNDVRVGNQSNATLINYTYWIDDVAAATGGYIGPVASSATQTAAPVGDVIAGSWVPSTGTSLYATIDETTPADSDYDASPQSPVSAVEMKVRLASVADPAVGTGHVIHYRYQKDVSGGDTINLTVTLYRADGVTVIASWVHTNIQNGVVQADQTLTTTQADAIPSVDYSTGLVLGFKAVKV